MKRTMNIFVAVILVLGIISYFYIKRVRLHNESFAQMEFTKVRKGLINQDADDNAKRLYQFLRDSYGKMILTGQFIGKSEAATGMDSQEFAAIYALTGEYPAILGLDFMEYSPSRVAFGSVGKDTDKAIDWAKRGGIVTFCWHWNAPKDLINTTQNPWWSGFYTKATTFDLAKAISKEDLEGYDLILRDIDAIAAQLAKLKEEGVPVLFRPLHEASGGWFWWGAKGAQPYKQLWILLYDRLTQYHKLNNIIWIWNGQDKSWYPGDEYADIIGVDLYAKDRDYSSQLRAFMKAIEYSGEYKIVALTENGVVPDVDLMLREHAYWAWYSTWNGDFVVDEQGELLETKTEKDILRKMFTSDNTYKLSNLPDLQNYRIE